MKFIDKSDKSISKAFFVDIKSIKNDKIVPCDIPGSNAFIIAAIEYSPINLNFMIAFNDEDYFIVYSTIALSNTDLELTYIDRDILEECVSPQLIMQK